MCSKCEVCIVGGGGGRGGIGGWIQRKLSSFQSFVKSQGTTERGHHGVCVPFKYQNALSVQHWYDRECFSCWTNITLNLKSVDLNSHLAIALLKTNALSAGVMLTVQNPISPVRRNMITFTQTSFDSIFETIEERIRMLDSTAPGFLFSSWPASPHILCHFYYYLWYHWYCY